MTMNPTTMPRLMAGLMTIGAALTMACEPSTTETEEPTEQEGSPEQQGAAEQETLILEERHGEALTQLGRGDHRQWLVESSGDDHQLLLLIHEAQGGPTEPGTYRFGDDETSAATCGICLRILSDCQAPASQGPCETTLMPSGGGEIEIEELGDGEDGHFRAVLRSVPLRPVQIDPSTLSTEVLTGDASDYMVEELLLDMDVHDMDLHQPCGGHGQLHGDHCHCDPGYQLNPADPLECVPEETLP